MWSNAQPDAQCKDGWYHSSTYADYKGPEKCLRVAEAENHPGRTQDEFEDEYETYSQYGIISPNLPHPIPKLADATLDPKSKLL